MKLIPSSKIGKVRRFLFVPWDSWWNAFIRDITAKLEYQDFKDSFPDVVEKYSAKSYNTISVCLPEGTSAKSFDIKGDILLIYLENKAEWHINKIEIPKSLIK